MSKKEIGLVDCEGRNVCVGDLIECSAPIFTNAKRFVIGYDDIARRYNYPIAAELSSHCRIITQDEHQL